jgi:hypothetical protein
MRLMDVNFCTETATTLTASTSDTSFPVSNLKNPFRSKRWRSTGCTSENVVFDMQTTEDINSVVILWPKEDGIRLTSSAVIKIQANATNVWTAPAVDQVLTIDNDFSIASHYFSTDQSYRYWRLLITDATNPWGYIEIGQVWLGKSLDLENAENGFVFSLVDQSDATSNNFGHEYVDEYPQMAQLSVVYSYIDYDTYTTLETAYRRNGNRKPVLLILDPEENVFNKDHFVLYGKMQNKFAFEHIRHEYGNSSLVIKELA